MTKQVVWIVSNAVEGNGTQEKVRFLIQQIGFRPHFDLLEGQDASQINKVLLDIEKLLKLVPIDPKSKGYSSFFVESLAHSISKLKLLEKNESSKNSHARRTHCRRAWPVQYRDVVSARSLLNY